MILLFTANNWTLPSSFSECLAYATRYRTKIVGDEPDAGVVSDNPIAPALNQALPTSLSDRMAYMTKYRTKSYSVSLSTSL